MSIQNTSGDKCVFRERFVSPQTVAANGGTSTGTPTIRYGATPTANSNRIVYSKRRTLLNGATKATFKLKFKTGAAAVSAVKRIFYKLPASANDNQFHIQLTSAGKLQIYVASSASDASNYAYWNSALTASTEYVAHIVYDGTAAAGSRIAFYVNGTNQTATIVGTIPAAMANGTQPPTVFNYADGGTSAPDTDFVMRELAVYKGVAFTQAEAADDCEQDTVSEIDASKALVSLPLKSWHYKENGTELLTDGDMETAGVAAWTAGNNAVLTKQTTSPYAGTQCLRIAYDGTGTPTARQTILTDGRRYKITGWGRGDGTYKPTVYVGSGKIGWQGTAANTWQYFDVEFVAEAVGYQVRLASSASAAGYSEFDDCSVELMEAQTENVGSLKGAAYLGDKTTTTKFPTQLAPHGMSFDGGDYAQITNTLLNTLGKNFTLALAFKVTGGINFVGLIDKNSAGSAAASPQTVWLSSSKVVGYIGNGASAVGITSTDNITLGVLHTVVFAGDGTNMYLYVDGVSAASAAAQSITPTSGNTDPFIIGGSSAASGLLTGSIYDVKIASFGWTATQAAIYHKKILKEINI